MADLTTRLAEFVVGASPARDAPEVVDAALRPIADTVGVIVAGSAGPAGQAILRYAAGLGRSGGSNWLGCPSDLPPETIALVSSTLGHALDFDDDRSGVGHPSSIALSALLALPGTADLSGSALVDAFAVGYEVNVRVAEGMGPAHYRHGWHTTGTVGGFGAAAGVCKLLGLDVAQTRAAFGIVASLASGLRRNFGTMTKPLHSGLAARNGVLAAQLASSGFTADTDILAGRNGFYDVYSDGASEPAALGRLGRPYALGSPGPTLKKYPCGYATHRAIDGMRELRQRHGLRAEDVERVVCTVPTQGLTPLVYPRPATGLQGKFSLEYTLAAALVDGEVTLDSFTDDAVRRAEIRRLLPRIRTSEDPRCRPDDPAGRNSSSGIGGFVELIVVSTDGTEMRTVVDHASGSPQRPMSWDELARKFEGCLRAGGRDPERGMRAFQRLRQLPGQSNLERILAELT